MHKISLFLRNTQYLILPAAGSCNFAADFMTQIFFKPFDLKFEMRRSKPNFFVAYEVKEIAKLKK